MRGKFIVEKSANTSIQQRPDSILSYDIAWLVLMVVVAISAVVAQVYAFIPKVRKRQSSNHKQRYEETCQRCQYFHHNLYLKCAIHPDTVLTEDSIDCKDYCQKK
jgi:hypothetical protein